LFLKENSFPTKALIPGNFAIGADSTFVWLYSSVVTFETMVLQLWYKI